MEREEKANILYIFFGIAAGAALTFLAPKLVNAVKGGNLEEKFVNPNKAKMKITNLDKNGKNESVLKYEGRNYLMKYNPETNTVSVVPYEIQIQEK